MTCVSSLVWISIAFVTIHGEKVMQPMFFQQSLFYWTHSVTPSCALHCQLLSPMPWLFHLNFLPSSAVSFCCIWCLKVLNSLKLLMDRYAEWLCAVCYSRNIDPSLFLPFSPEWLLTHHIKSPVCSFAMRWFAYDCSLLIESPRESTNTQFGTTHVFYKLVF